MLPAACGLLSGWLYASNLGEVQSWRLPGLAVRLARVFAPLVASAPPPPLPRLPGARGGAERDPRDGGFGGGGGVGGGAADANAEAAFLRDATPAGPPSEDDVATLMGMGFDRDAVLAALAAAGNSVQIAADRLLAS